MGIAMPRLRFGWLAALGTGISAAIGLLSYLTGPEPPLLLKFLALIWVFPTLPGILFWTAVKQARARGHGLGTGLVLSLFLSFTGFGLVFVPMAEADPASERTEQPGEERPAG